MGLKGKIRRRRKRRQRNAFSSWSEAFAAAERGGVAGTGLQGGTQFYFGDQRIRGNFEENNSAFH